MSTDPIADTDRSRFAEFLADYFVECDEHLALARRALLGLESLLPQERIDKSLVDELFRSFHSLKGLSAMVGFQEPEQLAHHLESFLGAVRRNQTQLTLTGLETLVSGVVALEQVIAARRDQSQLPELAPLLTRIAALLPVAGTAVAGETRRTAPSSSLGEKGVLIAEKIRTGQRAWEIVFRPSAELSQRGIDVNAVRKQLQGLGEIVHSSPVIAPTGGIEFSFILLTAPDVEATTCIQGEGLICRQFELPAPAAAPVEAIVAQSAEEGSSTHLTPANVVRVDLDRLDELMRLVGELVLSRARLDEGLSHLRSAPTAQLRGLRETASTIERQLRDLREGVMRVRMVPIREVFVRMQFVIRDLVREAGKQVSLRLTGEDTQIDKYVVERIMDPLLHLVRNAVSHGLESPEQRVANGKQPEGLIHLRAKTLGETVVIEVEDDGRGIDADQVLKLARARGIPLALDRMDDSQLLDVLCVPGFSTRQTVDRVSGRGIGMDVVRQTVEELGGQLTLSTAVGRGSRFEIQLPLTVSITEALIVQVGEQRYAVPQVSIREIIKLETAELTVMEQNDLLRYREGALPILWLSRFFGSSVARDRQHFALVVGEGSQAAGIAVDRVLGLQEIVVRPLTDALVQVPGISGATELGDGRVVLILDTSRLVRGGRKNAPGPQLNIPANRAAHATGAPHGV
ncbi:Chemotaxis protein CheA [Anatilimnocola aggregata]|uniref:histidine kinase n=1 Tax=Anatilimnocola aggregata TaxID=2528021 RepID=A0A517YF99_9BACT|nr:chemotaxis protein CheA [Anatilimnocola aggregata]QDU28913.1 Chemotaxis protein CheA [Anatilimnocola aggregata]